MPAETIELCQQYSFSLGPVCRIFTAPARLVSDLPETRFLPLLLIKANQIVVGRNSLHLCTLSMRHEDFVLRRPFIEFAETPAHTRPNVGLPILAKDRTVVGAFEGIF